MRCTSFSATFFMTPTMLSTMSVLLPLNASDKAESGYSHGGSRRDLEGAVVRRFRHLRYLNRVAKLDLGCANHSQHPFGFHLARVKEIRSQRARLGFACAPPDSQPEALARGLARRSLDGLLGEPRTGIVALSLAHRDSRHTLPRRPSGWIGDATLVVENIGAILERVGGGRPSTW